MLLPGHQSAYRDRVMNFSRGARVTITAPTSRSGPFVEATSRHGAGTTKGQPSNVREKEASFVPLVRLGGLLPCGGAVQHTGRAHKLMTPNRALRDETKDSKNGQLESWDIDPLLGGCVRKSHIILVWTASLLLPCPGSRLREGLKIQTLRSLPCFFSAPWWPS